MAIQTKLSGLTWWEKLFGQETVIEFAAPHIAVGDEVIVSGCRWHVDAITGCPYLSIPAEYADYTLAEDWCYVWNVDNDRRFVLSDYVPVAHLVSMIERGE
jgi:hypothetical protein